MFKCKCDPLSPTKSTKKGGFIRDFLVTLPDGTRNKVAVWSNEMKDINFEGVKEIDLRFNTDFAFLA